MEIKRRSQVIIDLINNKIDVVQAFEILELLLEDINDEKIKEWLKLEKNGYNKDDEIPKYRIIPATVVGSYIAGTPYNMIKGTSQTLPIKTEYLDDFQNIKIREGVREIQQMSTAEKELETHSLIMPINMILAQEISYINGQITSANIHLSMYGYLNIIEKLKSKLLDIFKELEKNYGNLDEFYINFKNDKEKESKIINYITNIITDNSTYIGNNNKISDSVIGDANEK